MEKEKGYVEIQEEQIRAEIDIKAAQIRKLKAEIEELSLNL